MAFVFAGAALSFTAGTRAPVASMHHVRAPVAVMHHGEGEHDLMPRAGRISMSAPLQDDFLYGARGRAPASRGPLDRLRLDRPVCRDSQEALGRRAAHGEAWVGGMEGSCSSTGLA